MIVKHSEKRDYYRMRIEHEFQYTPFGEERTVTGFCRNLSHTGIQFDTAEILSPGQSLDITLGPPMPVFQPLMATAKVIRVEQIANNRYLVAAQIVKYR